ncbi:hypothetical protein [uncultured Microbacterium sp.]|uniref:hypothetical protein n=1 Tax=uncultured Microbacterium sp. TaxID=191216 RepID=UPI0026185BD2|nr:hypothetical protein [uncultured Microbacterium sp.]
MVDMVETRELVPGAHRAVRRLDGTESPFIGALVTDGERQRVSMDAGTLDPALWEFAGAEHIAGVRDLLAGAAGQHALLPWCVEPVDVFLARRTAAGSALVPGEIVTLVGSLLRGVVEAGGHPVTGRWWLDDRARPLFAPGEGASCTASAAALVESVRAGCGDRALERVLGRIEAGLADHRAVTQAIGEWEGELTELAAPRALEREVHAPERVRDIPVHHAVLARDLGAGEESPGLWERARERCTVLADWGRDRVPRRLLRGTRHPAGGSGTAQDHAARPQRRRMLLIGVGTAALVLTGGMLWPSAEEEPAGPHAVAAERTASPAATATAVPTAETPAVETSAVPEEPESDGSELAREASRLLSVVDGCRKHEDAACAAAVVDGAGAAVLERLGADAVERATSLIEDYGDVAVIRVARTASQGEQMLVMVQGKDGWLVRDVYDVADQPSGEG